MWTGSDTSQSGEIFKIEEKIIKAEVWQEQFYLELVRNANAQTLPQNPVLGPAIGPK